MRLCETTINWRLWVYSEWFLAWYLAPYFSEVGRITFVLKILLQRVMIHSVEQGDSPNQGTFNLTYQVP